MNSDIEELLSRRVEGKLSRSQKRLFHAAARESASFRRSAARDRLIDRILRESFKEPLNPDHVLKAISRQRGDLVTRTMAALDETKRAFQQPAARGHPFSIAEWLRGHIPACIGVLTLIVVGIFVGFYLKAQRPAEIGRLISVVGAPVIQSSSGKSAEVKVSGNVHFGDRLETGDADAAEIQFLDGSTLRLQFNTAVRFSRTKQDEKTSFLRPPEIALLHGQLWTKVHSGTNATPYAIRTAAATAVARGTEFGVKFHRTEAPGTNTAQAAALEATLTVKEGTVDFFNAFGSVRATAMCESTARADAAPTEPKRLQTLQVIRLDEMRDWTVTTAPLAWPDAAERLAGGGGWAGLKIQDFLETTNAATGGSSTNMQIRVVSVVHQSPAEVAGIRRGDLVLAINGQELTNAEQIERTILISAGVNSLLRVRRGAEANTLTLKAVTRPSILKGSTLAAAEQAGLSRTTRQFFAYDRSNREQTLKRSQRSLALASAVDNNLGVSLELGDAIAPAIRAYGRAVRANPRAPLYRFNLALALRKIGSFERALEEIETVIEQAPESSLARQTMAEIQSLLGRQTEALSTIDEAIRNEPHSHALWELKAQVLTKQNRLSEARDCALKAIELEPRCAVAHGYLAGVLHDQGQLAQAEQKYRDALDLDPYHALLHLNLGTVYQEGHRAREARESFYKAIELRPSFTLAWRALGKLCIEEGKQDEAFRAVEAAITLDPEDGEAHGLKGSILLSQKRIEDAKESYSRAVELSPQDARWRFGLGEVYREKRELSMAEALYRKALEIDPHYADAHTGLGLLHHERAEFDAEEKSYRKAIELDATESAAYHNLGELYRTVRGQPGEAEKYYRKALALDPKQGETCLGLGQLMAARGDFESAEKWMKQAIALDPNSSAFHNTLGELHRAQGNLPEAERLYRKAVELDPENLEPYGNLGILHAMRREFPKAELMLRAVLQRAADSPLSLKLPALVNLGSVCAEQGKLEDAEAFFRQALDLDPVNPRVCNGLAWFLAEHRLKLDEAAALAAKAVQAAPNDPHFLDTLGWVQFQRSEFDQAEATLKKALELSGDNPPANEILEHLKKVRETRSASAK